MVWLASTAPACDPQWADAQARLFDPSEARRLARITRSARRAQFVAVHVAARRLVATQLEMPAPRVDLEIESDGRPVLRSGVLAISLSHSADRVAAVAARSAVGVDIERLRPGRGRDVVEPWAVAEARWKAGDAHAPAWLADVDDFVLAVAGCAEPPSAHWFDPHAPDAAAAALVLPWRVATGAPQ